MKDVAFFVFLLLGATVSAQNISNVDFHQVGDDIIITYALDESSDVWLYVSLDGGKSYGATFSTSGDVGRVVQPGKKRIVWKVLYDIPEGLDGQVQFKVSANLFVSIDGVEFEMVYVKGGTFMMGATEEHFSMEDDEKPVHTVTLSDYYIGKFEVTQGLWEKVMGTTIKEQAIKANWEYGCAVRSDYPMHFVNWNEVQEFCKKLGRLTGWKFVLPTEAQWEYAARGGAKSMGYEYSGSNDIDKVASYESGVQITEGCIYSVGTLLPNELGIYDMSGNVQEWCRDWYDENYYSNSPTINPMGPSSGSYRVQRGGSFIDPKYDCYVSIRNIGDPDGRYGTCGFRVVMLPQ